MFPLVSLLTQFLLVALLVQAAVLGGVVGYFYLRARRVVTGGTLSGAERRELQQRDAEISAIRSRVEEIFHYQQVGAETQHQIIHQQIEHLQQHLQARTRQIEGLQSQLRHEMQQREAAMAELRSQLSQALQVITRPALLAGMDVAPAGSVPEAALQFPARQEPSSEDEVGLSSPVRHLSSDESVPAGDFQPAPPPEHAETAPSLGWTWEPIELDFRLHSEGTADFGREDDLISLFPVEDDTQSTQRAASTTAGVPERPAFTPLDAFLRDDPARPAPAQPAGHEPAHESNVGAGKPTTVGSGDGGDGLDGVIRWTPLQVLDETEQNATASGQFAGGDGSSTVASPARSAPPGTDDLSALSAVGVSHRAMLQQLGVTTVEEIARWTRSDAHRMASYIEGATEETIMNDWVFEAQSILFDRYQQVLSARRNTS
jgi:predicted flap endonuclease-1-like 5' DNA nuclease